MACTTAAAVAIHADLWLTADQVDRVVDLGCSDGVCTTRRIPYEGVSLRGLVSLATAIAIGVPLSAAARRRLRDAGLSAKPLFRFAYVTVLVPVLAFALVWLSRPVFGYLVLSLVFILTPVAGLILLVVLIWMGWLLSKPSVPETGGTP